MIDPSRTRQQMLDEIGAAEVAGRRPGHDLAALTCDEALVVLEGADAPTLLARLYPALSARYDRVPHDRLWRDLLDPIKKSVGNAWKHGNRKDPAKRVTVELVATPRGLFAAVTDQGPGFDVADVLAKLESQLKYFNHHGSGFKHFSRARSVMNFADGGRTFLLRFLLEDTLADGEPSGGGVLDADAMSAALAARLRPIREGQVEIVSCGRLPGEDLPSVFDAAYRIELAAGDRVRKFVLSARAVEPRAARAERSAARALRRGAFRPGAPVRIPRPLVALRDLGFVLYPLDASHDLRDHVHAGDLATTVESIERVGRALRRLHLERIDVPRATRAREIDRQAGVLAGVEITLRRTAPARAARARGCFDDTATALRGLTSWPTATIHGSFGWNVVLWDGARLHVVAWDACRSSHPGLDVGGFMIDLRRIFGLRAKADPRLYPAALEAFVSAYFGGDSPPWREHLDLFTAFALPPRLERLMRRSEKKWEAKVDGLLDEWERLLGRPAPASR